MLCTHHARLRMTRDVAFAARRAYLQPPGISGRRSQALLRSLTGGASMSQRSHFVHVLPLLRAVALPSLLGAGLLGLGAPGAALGQPICRPVLAFRDVHFSAMDQETLTRTWTARLAVDASRCATASGRFEIGFAQLR